MLAPSSKVFGGSLPWAKKISPQNKQSGPTERVPHRRHVRDRQWRRKWSGRCGGGWTSSQIGVAVSRLLVAKHKHKAGSCPSLHNECLRALTTKPKKLAGYGPHRKCADV
jgi:hypothetical protein